MKDAVSELETRMSAPKLPLSVCYRCPKEVITLAQQIVPQIEACDWAPEGQVSTIVGDEFRTLVAEGDLVLCRCVKPLVTECLALIRLGKRAKVKGRDIGEQLKSVVMRLARNGTQTAGEFSLVLDTYFNTQMDRLSKLRKISK